MVLPDILWANYFGRRSLGKIRGLGLLISQLSRRLGPAVLRFSVRYDRRLRVSFAIFGAALVISAFLSLMLRPPLRI